MASADELREYVRRDWAFIGRAKREFWIDRRDRMSAIEALRIADELRRHVNTVRPALSVAADRAADLAAHVRLTEILDRATAVAKR